VTPQRAHGMPWWYTSQQGIPHLTVTDLAGLVAQGAVPAGRSPLPPIEDGDAVEVERTVNRSGSVALGQHIVLAAEILGGRRVGIRIEPATLMFYELDSRELLRTRPNPLTPSRSNDCAVSARPGHRHACRRSRSGSSGGCRTPGSSWSPVRRSPWAGSTSTAPHGDRLRHHPGHRAGRRGRESRPPHHQPAGPQHQGTTPASRHHVLALFVLPGSIPSVRQRSTGSGVARAR